MKTGILTTKTIASDDIKDNKSIMGMSAKGMEMAQYFLRDKIYSDKILAVVREYISNAQDEHIKHKIDKAVEIKLSELDNKYTWSVRDYAKGLDEHDIRNIFGVYFESTKSDENNSAGGFGIGGKSGFSYSDTFYVNSHHNGVKSCYVCTLGAGTKGIPVGELYKISDEPTDEQGIEVSIEVKSSDVSSFSSKTSTFVKFYSHRNVVFENDYEGETITPVSPIDSKELGDYVFNTYDDRPFYDTNNKYYIRMGGVVYPHSHSSCVGMGLYFNKSIIIDVPIGKLSIPISRESIETTPLNDKVFKDIDAHLLMIRDEEVANVVTPKFGNVTSGHESFSKSYYGIWFNYDYTTLFPKTRKWYYHVGRIMDTPHATTGAVSEGPKHLVYIVPGIQNVNNWHKRLIKALKTVKGVDYKGYIYMSKPDYEAMMLEVDKSIDLSDCSFVDVKTLKLPKLETDSIDKTKYLVYSNNNYYNRKEYYTAEELDKHVRDSYFKGEDLEDDWYLECNGP